ncbi:uncharacterized protein METZ01_LOCUS92816 [marine metagenome]|uniref:Uncharacterized protein n=1 Tax=marine metagenome TaxID=408172 RepID=A0A381VI34_9ZZZZ
MTEEKSEKKLTFLKKLNEMPPDTSKGVTGAVGLDNPNKTHGHPAVAGHMGIEIITNDGKIEVQRPPKDKPFTIDDYSELFQVMMGDKKNEAEKLNRAAEAALTKEGRKMAEDFQLIKRKEFINAEAEVAEKESERTEEERKKAEKADRREKSRALAAEYNRRQEAGEDLTEFYGNIHPQSDLAQEQGVGMQIAMRPKLAVNVMRAQLPLEVMDELNDHIDDTIIPNDVDYSEGLVGQIRQNEKSKQLHFPHKDDEYGEQLSTVLLKLANEYMDRTVGLPCDIDMQSMWTVHSYEGDYNPVHDHGTRTQMGLSCIMYLKVPPQIEALDNPSEEFGGLNQSSGAIDGFTYLVWGVNGMRDINMLRPITEEYIKPEVGTLLMFPAWLRHGVNPFFGEGERRTLSANINVLPKAKEISEKGYNQKVDDESEVEEESE